MTQPVLTLVTSNDIETPVAPKLIMAELFWDEFRSVVRAALIVASKDETRRGLHSLNLHSDGTMLRVRATDGHRAIELRMPVREGNAFEVTFDRDALDAWSKLKPINGLPIALKSENGEPWQLVCPGTTVTLRTVGNDRFPPVDQVIPARRWSASNYVQKSTHKEYRKTQRSIVDAICIHAPYLADVGKVGKELGLTNVAIEVGDDDLAPVRFDFTPVNGEHREVEACLVQMPTRLD